MTRINSNQRDTGPMVRAMESAMTGAPFIALGDKRTASGRQFTAVEVEPYTRRDGGESQLVTWRGRCATCEATYEVKGSRNAAHLPVNCPSHRGKRTRHSKRRREMRDAIERAIAAIDAGDVAGARETLAGQLRGRA